MAASVDFPDDQAAFPFDSCNLLLGKGGSGAVFLARHHVTSQLVAVKRCYTRRGDALDVGAGCIDVAYGPVGYPVPLGGRPHSPRESGRELGVVGAAAGCTAASTDRPPGLGNETGMREESNLECAASQLPSNAPHTAPVSPVSPASPWPAGSRPDEVAVLQYLGPHPHIVELLGSYTSTRRIRFFAMGLMDSDVGRELRSGNGCVRSEDACAVFGYSVLEAVAHVHAMGVAHRDVKPGNVFLRRVSPEEAAGAVLVSGGALTPSVVPAGATAAHLPGLPERRRGAYVKAYLGDFSAAHAVAQEAAYATLATRGTLHYKAPEQLFGKHIADFTACDMWAVGATLLEMATGELAFPGTSEMQVLMSILDRLGSGFAEYPLSTRPASLFDSLASSPRLVDLLRHLLVLDPAQRYTARQALDHPFFAPLRQRQQHLTQQLACTAAGVGAGAVPAPPPTVCLRVRLLSARCPEAAQLRVSFRPVAMTPHRKRRRAVADVDGVPAQWPHPLSVAGTGVAGGSPLQETNSFLSEGPSLHWSQVCSTVGSSREASTVMDTAPSHHASDGSTTRGPPPMSGRLACSQDGRAVAVHASAGGSADPLTSTTSRLCPPSPLYTLARSQAGPASHAHTHAQSHLAPSSPARAATSMAGGCLRPVLVAASGTSFTAGNLRAYDALVAMARSPCTAAGPVARRGGHLVHPRPLTYSSDDRTLSPDEGGGCTEPSGSPQSVRQTPTSRTRKALVFESPVREPPLRPPPPPVRVGSSAAAHTPRTFAASTTRSTMTATTTATAGVVMARPLTAERLPVGAHTNSPSAAPRGQSGSHHSDEVNASVILGVDSYSPLSEEARSCCSTAAATPVSFLHAHPLPSDALAMESSGATAVLGPRGGHWAMSVQYPQRPAHASHSGAGDMFAETDRSPSTIPPAPPLPISLLEAAAVVARTSCGSGERTPVVSPAHGGQAVARLWSRRAPPWRAAPMAASVRATTASTSSGSSTTPRRVFDECGLNVSRESGGSSACSPVPRALPTGDGVCPRRWLFGAQQSILLGPAGRRASGGRHCTPSQEQPSASTPKLAAADSRERSRSGLMGVSRDVYSAGGPLFQATDELGAVMDGDEARVDCLDQAAAHASAKKRMKLESPAM